MNNKEVILGRLNLIAKDVFHSEEIILLESTVASDIDCWDSIGHIELIIAIEKFYGIKFKLGELMNFKNVGDMVNSISKLLS
jgi:acyl carrier protein